MWKRKELKDKAKKVLKKNYWSMIIVCFILAICTGEFGMSSTSIEKNDESIVATESLTSQVEQMKENFEGDNKEFKEQMESIVASNVNSALKSQKYVYKIIDAVGLFSKDSIVAGIALCVGAGIAFLFIVFVADPLIVGGRRFFIKARKSKLTKVGIMGSIFNRNEWLNIVKIMFLRNIFTALWYLTIIGGVIKTYEYKMIPYLLAENPQIKRKEAFKLSKQMMKGNKWKAFVLDLSFLPWDIASIFTLGFLSILYVNPYIVATNTELYMYLKEEAIKEQYEYYECLIQNKDIKKDIEEKEASKK